MYGKKYYLRKEVQLFELSQISGVGSQNFEAKQSKVWDKKSEM